MMSKQHSTEVKQSKIKHKTRQVIISPFLPFSRSLSLITPSFHQNVSGSAQDKASIFEMIEEWNSRICVPDPCERWKKDRSVQNIDSRLLILLFNVEGLRTHVTDVDILLNSHKPHVCILMGVGAAAKSMVRFPFYTAHTQHGTNSYEGVAILYQDHLECKIAQREATFLPMEPVMIGAMYVSPSSLPPFPIIDQCKNKPFYIFGDYNAKHTAWGCKKNNTSRVHMLNWLGETGNDVIMPIKPTSRRSEALIDFGVSDDANEWTSEVLHEGTSDHWPILFQSPISIEGKAMFRMTNWKTVGFFLPCVFQYWNSLAYNLDTDIFFSLLSSFLAALQGRCSTYKRVDAFRPPCSPELLLLVTTAKTSAEENIEGPDQCDTLNNVWLGKRSSRRKEPSI